jgi:hypothetical protein
MHIVLSGNSTDGSLRSEDLVLSGKVIDLRFRTDFDFAADFRCLVRDFSDKFLGFKGAAERINVIEQCGRVIDFELNFRYDLVVRPDVTVAEENEAWR